MPKRGVNQGEAEDIVFGNLDLSSADLGLDDESRDFGGGDDFGDGDDDGEGNVQSRRQQFANAGDDGGEGDDFGEGGEYDDEVADDPRRAGRQRDDFDQPQRRSLFRRGDQRGVNHTQHGRNMQFQPPQFERTLNGPQQIRADRDGNLWQGNKMVARAGKEARMYKDAHQARQTAQGFRQAANDYRGRLGRAVEIAQELQRRLEQREAQDEAIQRFGLTPQEQLEAMTMFAEGKTSPETLLKKLLTRAAAGGIDLTKMGLQNGGGVDTAQLFNMLRTEIDNRMKPLRERNEAEQRRQEEEQRREASLNRNREHLQDFFNSNPEAVQYLPAFRALMADGRFRNMSVGEMWARIQLAETRRAHERRGQPNPRSSRQRSLPNGRGAGRISSQRQESGLADPSMSYDTILKEVFEDEGIPLR